MEANKMVNSIQGMSNLMYKGSEIYKYISKEATLQDKNHFNNIVQNTRKIEAMLKKCYYCPDRGQQATLKSYWKHIKTDFEAITGLQGLDGYRKVMDIIEGMIK